MIILCHDEEGSRPIECFIILINVFLNLWRKTVSLSDVLCELFRFNIHFPLRERNMATVKQFSIL